MALVSALGLAKPLAAGAMVLACLCDPPPEDINASLRQAAQHFADLEDVQARAILEKLADYDVPEARVMLGHLYADPLYAGRDYEKAVVAFEEAAASGSNEALFQVAESRFWPDYSAWTLTPDEKAVRPTLEETFWLLLRVAAANHDAGKWRLAWFCTLGGYDCGAEEPEAAAAASGPVASEPDVDIACTKLSMPTYFERFGIAYRQSQRYAQCRAMVLSDPARNIRF